MYSVYIKSGNTLNYLLHKNYKLYRRHIRVILKRNSESVAIGYLCPEQKSGRPGVSEEDAERVRETFDYRLDVCRVTHGSHIESL
jgi:hypothetical protein